jgi:hypothetical protein
MMSKQTQQRAVEFANQHAPARAWGTTGGDVIVELQVSDTTGRVWREEHRCRTVAEVRRALGY